MKAQPDHWPTLFQTGQSMESGDDPATAAVYYWNAATLAPRRPLHWQSLSHALQKASQRSERPLGGYFSSLKTLPGLDYEAFVSVVCEFVAGGSLLPQIQDAFSNDELSRAQLCLSIITALLAQNPLPRLDLEPHLAALRSGFLAATAHDRLQDIDPGSQALLSALALQCFLNEYLYPSSNDENQMIDALLDNDGGLNGPQLSLVGAFRPLHRIDSLSLATDSMSPWMSRLLRRQIQEPQLEYRLRREIGQLTPIRDDVSKAVQQQYEENPYPRWSDTARTQPQTVEKVLTAILPAVSGAQESTKFPIEWPTAPRVLIAGCGTGRHPIMTAGRFSDANILAIDLSLPSLAYARRRSMEYGMQTIEFAQADILELATLDMEFDIIESTGVLHHLAEPRAGLAILTGLLKKGGLMRLGFYSEAARRDVVAARNLAEQNAVKTDADGLRAFRKQIIELPDDHPAKGISQSSDFFTLSGLRDLSLNIQEHRYSLDGLKDLLDQQNLEFLGFELAGADVLQAYRHRFPDDPYALSLNNWTVYEQDHPQTFASMYQFWVLKR